MLSLRRKAVNAVMLSLTGVCTFLAVGTLLFILGYLFVHGGTSLTLNFFTKLPTPVGELGGGMANALLGSAKLLLLASCIGIPIGFLGGVYLAEFGGSSFSYIVRYTTDLLNGVPSIVIGIFAYTLIVLPQGHFSTFSGGLALGVMMIPIAIRSSEDFLRAVPVSMREGAMALGASKAKTIFTVVIPAAKAGLITGVMLNIARVAGETAPLIFTAFGNRFWSPGWEQPTASLPVMIWLYATSPYADWKQQAWSAGFVLLMLVLLINVFARMILSRRGLSKMSPMQAPSPQHSSDVTMKSQTYPMQRAEEKKPVAGEQAKLSATNLNFYYGAFQALHGISMQVYDKKVTAFIGPSGCGKSTFLRTLNRMYETIRIARVEGKIMLDGEDIFKLEVSELRKRVGMVFQRPNPFSKSIFDNIAYGPRINGSVSRSAMKDHVEQSLRRAALWDEVKDKLNQSAYGLSGGQQQRLCIARALAVNPEVLLLDEPCSALDRIATAKIEDLIFQLKDSCTIVIVTHNMQQAARVADYTGFFLMGKLIEFDNTTVIFKNPAKKETEDYITGRFG